MGREQRSRRKLPPGTVCYLCLKPIEDDQDWNRDHVPPQRIFGSRLRQQFSLELKWLPTHAACNSAAKPDEEYFVVALVGHHLTPTGQAVWEDIARGVRKGHDVGLVKKIIGQFGKVSTPDGAITFALDGDRARRTAWKIIRGLYALDTAAPLPEAHPHLIEIVPQSEAEKRLKDHAWFPVVRDTEPLGRHGAVFDYKWIGVSMPGFRAHAIAMLFWDSMVVLSLFHDPSCPCDDCLIQTVLAMDSHAGSHEAG